jgi:hypothetical protein
VFLGVWDGLGRGWGFLGVLGGCGNLEKKSTFLCFHFFANFEKIGVCLIFEKQKKALFFVRRLSKNKSKQNC